MNARSRASSVWVVIHCEFFARSSNPSDGASIDEMVFHVAGTRKRAERYVKSRGVSEHSWWLVQQRVVDQPNNEADDRPQQYFYNHRGQPRQSPPHKAALRAFEKQRLLELEASKPPAG